MGRINVAYAIFEGPSGPNKDVKQSMGVAMGMSMGKISSLSCLSLLSAKALSKSFACTPRNRLFPAHLRACILAEGAIALSVTLSGGALFAS